MKTLFNMMRSIITSFLFIILTIAIMIQFFFTMFRLQGDRLSNLIDRENIYILVADDIRIKDNPLFKNVSIKYIDDYINYVFYKRSFPSIDVNAIENLEENNKKDILESIDIVKNKIDLDYETILQIRDVNNFISNGSIYLLINIAIMFLFILISILRMCFYSGFKYLSVGLVISSLLILMSGVIISSKLLNSSNPIIVRFSKNIFNGTFISQFFRLVIIYMITGVILYLSLFIMDRLIKK